MGFQYFVKIFVHKIKLQENSSKTSAKKFIFSKAASSEPATLLKTEVLYRNVGRILLKFSVIKLHLNPCEKMPVKKFIFSRVPG